MLASVLFSKKASVNQPSQNNIKIKELFHLGQRREIIS